MALRGAYFLLESIGIFSLLTTPRRSAMKTSGNTILVNGGGSGIGLALAQRWHDAGNHVIVTGRHAPKLDAAIPGQPNMSTNPIDVHQPDANDAFPNEHKPADK